MQIDRVEVERQMQQQRRSRQHHEDGAGDDGDAMPLQKIVQERSWSSTTAARNSQVYCISDELLNTPAPTLIAGLHALAAAIHPEAFCRDGQATPGLRRITEVLQSTINRGGLV